MVKFIEKICARKIFFSISSIRNHFWVVGVCVLLLICSLKLSAKIFKIGFYIYESFYSPRLVFQLYIFRFNWTLRRFFIRVLFFVNETEIDYIIGVQWFVNGTKARKKNALWIINIGTIHHANYTAKSRMQSKTTSLGRRKKRIKKFVTVFFPYISAGTVCFK